MSRFSLTVKLRSIQLGEHSGDLEKAIDRVTRLFPWRDCKIGGHWSGLYPVIADVDEDLVYRGAGWSRERASALSYLALDIKHIHALAAMSAEAVYYARHASFSYATRLMGARWAEVLREHSGESFRKKYQQCFNPILTMSGLDDQGWIDFHNPTTEDPFWLGPPDLALRRAQKFESRFMLENRPDDILVCVDCHV